jgi:hypothetical protein
MREMVEVMWLKEIDGALLMMWPHEIIEKCGSEVLLYKSIGYI